MRLFEFDYRTLVSKLRSIYALIQRGATEGERSGAERAFERLLSTIARDFGKEKAAEAERQVKGSYGKQEPPRARTRRTYQEPPKREPPKKERQRREPKYATGSTYTHNEWTFTILRFTDPLAGKRGSDKVWGYAMNGDGRFMTFWGRFGKTVSTKEVDYHEAQRKFRQKAAKGYRPVNADPIDYGYIFAQSKNW